MPLFLVHLHADVFYDVEIAANDEDDAFDKATDAVYRNPGAYIDHKASNVLEASEAEHWIERVSA